MPPEMKGTQSLLGRCVSSEVRARIAAQRTSGKAVAAAVGVSQNYLAIRLRDEKPFTLDDVDRLMPVLGGDDVEAFIAEAIARHRDAVSRALDGLHVAPAGAPGEPSADDEVVPVPPSAEGIESTMDLKIVVPPLHPRKQPRTGTRPHGHSS